MDDRALANNIALFFATVIMGFLLYVIVEPAVNPILDLAQLHTSRQASHDGQLYIQQALDSAHFIVVGIGVLQLLVAAVYESRSVRP